MNVLGTFKPLSHLHLVMSGDEIDFLEEIAKLPSFHHPIISPDRERIAIYYDGTGRNELHVVDPETGSMEQWSTGQVPRNARWYLNWLDDRVLFHKDEDGNEQNDIWAVDSAGDAEVLVEQEGQTVIGDVSKDGSFLLFGSTRDGQMNVYRYDFDTAEVSKLTNYDRAVSGGALSPDGALFAYSTNETENYDNQDVYVAETDGSNARNLEIGDVGSEASPMDFTPDGTGLLVADNSADLGRAGIYDLEADEITWYGDGTFEESPVQVMPDGNRFVANRVRNAMTVPVVYDIDTGEATEFDVPDGVASFPQMGPGKVALNDHEVIFEFTSPTTRPELWRYDLDTHEHEVLIEAEYGRLDSEMFADATYEQFTSDGVPATRQAAVEHEPYEEFDIEIIFYDPGHRPSPLLVAPHGGPRGRDTLRFNLYMQTLASLGFSVVQVNYRGSTGRGREFVEELIDDWGGAEQGDVASAVEYVLDEYKWLDEDRVAVFGGSYGGYSAYWQLVQYPDLYDAGVAWIGLTDLEDMFENTMPHFRTELMEKYLGTPDDAPELYEERSPINHVENLAAPVLVVHGVNDRRVPVSQARLFKEALKEAGFEEGETGDFEYVELGKEGHASTDQEQKLRMFRTLEDFLTRRLDLPDKPSIQVTEPK